MKIARLSALLLFTMMLIPIGVSAHCKGKHSDAGPPHCEGEPPVSIMYEAKLTNPIDQTGAFVFDYEPVTVESRGAELRGDDPVTLMRPPDPEDPTLWDTVFAACPNYFGPTPVDVDNFVAPNGRKGWKIGNAGGVQLSFSGIPFTVGIGDVQVTLVLIGDKDFSAPFLPDDPPDADNPTEITHELGHFWIYGKSGSGVNPKHCTNGSEEGMGDLSPISILTIRAKLVSE